MVGSASQQRSIWSVALATAAVSLVVVGVSSCSGGDEETSRDGEADVVVFRPSLAADPVEAVLVAEADLRYEPGSFDELGASSDATVALALHDGSYVVGFLEDELDLAAPVGEDAGLEMWLIAVGNGSGSANVLSLGPVDPRALRVHTIPDGIDPAVYSVVDISVEPHDGDAAHSGRSILRGPFDFG